MGRRIRWLGVVMIICFALVLVQLVNIQFRKASSLANSPFNPQVVARRFSNLRGNITAANGMVLAKSVPTPRGSTSFKYMRDYPGGQLYAGVVGYDSAYAGTAGVEYEYNQYLTSHPQAPQNLSQLLFNKPPSEPDDITLTIDPVLQAAAFKALTTLPPGDNKDGGVVVLNPSTGAVLAMVSNPTYNPNLLTQPNVAQEKQAYELFNMPDAEKFFPIAPIATQERFFPGSTFKVVTSTAVYNLKPSLINYSFPPSPFVKFSDSDKLLYNDGGSACGGTMEAMLPASCDPGYAELGVQLGVSTLTKEAGLFGFSTTPSTQSQYVANIDLPNVVPSVFPPLASNAQADLGYQAIGQLNVQATPLQNALVAAGIANGGVIMTPHVMEQIRDSQDNTVKTYTPTPMLRAATQSAAASVNHLMQGVAQFGTAAGIFPASWDVAVKTGTAQVPGLVEKTDDWMIGFMPAKDPQIAIAVVVPYQEQDLTGAVVAGPIVRAVFQAYLSETGGQ
jgi:peptidoglycan glycosyltransferase